MVPPQVVLLMQRFVRICSADELRDRDGVKAIADYAGLPSTCTSERYVLIPPMPHEVLNFKPAHAADLLSALCAGSVHIVYNTVCVYFNMLTQSL